MKKKKRIKSKRNQGNGRPIWSKKRRELDGRIWEKNWINNKE